MTSVDLAALSEQYHSGLEAELDLLVQLQGIAARQRETTRAADIAGLKGVGDERDAITARLVTLVQKIRPAHEKLAREETAARRVPTYRDAVALHRNGRAHGGGHSEIDRDSILSLEQIVADRRRGHQPPSRRRRRWPLTPGKPASCRGPGYSIAEAGQLPPRQRAASEPDASYVAGPRRSAHRPAA